MSYLLVFVRPALLSSFVLRFVATRTRVRSHSRYFRDDEPVARLHGCGEWFADLSLPPFLAARYSIFDKTDIDELVTFAIGKDAVG